MTTLFDPPARNDLELDENGNYVVGLVYDSMDSRIELQILRDLLVLRAEYPIVVHDYGQKVSPGLLDELGIKLTESPPVLNVVYKIIDEWPYYDPDIPVVLRDLEVKYSKMGVDPNPKPGYYLTEQGRYGPNLTEIYLNRTAPIGNGLTDALTILLWGNG